MIATLVLLSALGAPASAAADTAPPNISFIPCEAFQKGRAFTVYARFDDESPLFDPKLVYRIVGDNTWRNSPFRAPANGDQGGVWRATVPKIELTGALEYFVEVFDENGNGPSRVGSPDKPLFARATRRSPECVAPSQVPVIAAAPVESVEPAGADPSVTVLAPFPEPERQTPSRCQQAERPFYCKPWFWIATGGVVAAAATIIAVEASHSYDRGYPDHVTLVVQPQALERSR